MIKSMTGFGKSSSIAGGKKITVEIRSLNSKQLDLNLRIPSHYRDKENEIRGLISKECERGKIDFSVYLEEEEKKEISIINKKLAKNYYSDLKSLAKELGAHSEEIFPLVLTMPGVLKPEKEALQVSEWKSVKHCIENAVGELNRFRSDEGKSLHKEIEKRIQMIKKDLNSLSVLDKKRLPLLREKLRNSIAELKNQVDENRFEQELIFYIEKLDITEEKVRLKTHCDYFLQTMKETNSGRKLNFISQEIGREINTIGSKANDAGIQKLVVKMKDELEKIKEQANNIL